MTLEQYNFPLKCFLNCMFLLDFFIFNKWVTGSVIHWNLISKDFNNNFHSFWNHHGISPYKHFTTHAFLICKAVKHRVLGRSSLPPPMTSCVLRSTLQQKRDFFLSCLNSSLWVYSDTFKPNIGSNKSFNQY